MLKQMPKTSKKIASATRDLGKTYSGFGGREVDPERAASKSANWAAASVGLRPAVRRDALVGLMVVTSIGLVSTA